MYEASGRPGGGAKGHRSALRHPESDFLAALEQLQEEKGVSRESLLELVQSSLATAFTKALGYPQVRVAVDPRTGAVSVGAILKVAATVHDPLTEIEVSEARRLRPGAGVGETVEKRLELEELGRLLAAQTARHVVLQRRPRRRRR